MVRKYKIKFAVGFDSFINEIVHYNHNDQYFQSTVYNIKLSV